MDSSMWKDPFYGVAYPFLFSPVTAYLLFASESDGEFFFVRNVVSAISKLGWIGT